MHDPHGALDTASRALSLYLNKVGRRVLWFKLARGAAFSAGAGLFLLLLCALTTGPNLGLLEAGLTWASVALGVVLAGVVGVGRLDDLSGERRAVLLAAYDRKLSERARSAAELARMPNGSSELVQALTRGVVNELSALPVASVIPRPRHWGRMSSLSTGIAAGCALALLVSEEAASGLFAMTHPALDDGHGTAVGLWVSRIDARVTFPPQLAHSPQMLIDPRVISVPEGAVIELSVVPRFEVERAVLRMGDHTLPLTSERDGKYRLTVTAESTQELVLRARVGEDWVTDSTSRKLVVAQDAPPSVALDAPLSDQRVDRDEPVPFVYRVTDDHGLEGVDLVVQLGPGRERRNRLQSFDAASQTKRHAGTIDVTPSSFGAHSGQTLAVWIEARDRDAFGGPNVGRSAVRTITVGEAEDAKAAPVELLERTRNLAVDTLGTRLERSVDEHEDDLSRRERELTRGTRTLVRGLETLAKAYTDSVGDKATAGLLRDMGRRLTRVSREEAAAGDRRDLRELRKLDDAAVGELEDDVLWLTDLLGRGKLANAQRTLERLEATRARMRELLEELKKTADPARKEELLAEIARARAELAELAQKLSQAQGDVPADFVNYEALAQNASGDPLEQLEKALAQGDMEAAEKALSELDQQLAGLQNGLDQGSQAFADSRFAPRNSAAEKARAELAELERSQKQLANDTGRVADKARARESEQGEFKAQAERLAKEAEALEKRAQRLEAGRMQPAVSEAQSNAAQRLRDARDALRQGDAREAQAMAERATDDLGALSTEMMLDARMYPGADGSRVDAAHQANELARDVERFSEEVAKVSPKEPDQLSPDEGQALKQQAPSQRSLGEKAGNLADKLKQDGPPSASEGLGRAMRSMRDAAGALERGDVREAQAHQRDALDRLGELNQELEKQARASGGSKRGGEEGEQASGDEKVVIPEGGEDPRRADLRRRVLDARRARTPDSFARSVERYYQEILR